MARVARARLRRGLRGGGVVRREAPALEEGRRELRREGLLRERLEPEKALTNIYLELVRCAS